MNALFWTFCTLLITLTLISAFGGGIRYRENFLQEMFDKEHGHSNHTNAKTASSNIIEKITFDQMHPIDNHAFVEDEMIPSTMVEPEEVYNEPVYEEPVKTSSLMTQQPSVPTMGPALIEAFDGDMFASF